MQLGIDGQYRSDYQPPRVRLYVDGSYDSKNSLGENWTYIGLLAIPEDKYQSAISLLNSDRQAASYSNEVHYKELGVSSNDRQFGMKTKLASLWAQRVMTDFTNMFHFHMFGFNTNKLQWEAFGPGKMKKKNAYNRFFRALTTGAMKISFRGRAVVTHVFHDKDDMSRHPLFDWHTIWRLNSSQPDLVFPTDRIEFIDSDHQLECTYPLDSHFIQLCDVILGGFRQCLDDSSTKLGCCEVAQKLLPLLQHLVDYRQCNNPNSRFNHANRLSVIFFPKEELTLTQLGDPFARALSGCYKNRPLLFHERISGQQRFPGF
ncbi:MAG: hypothetical protein M1319_06710 [Chloroflexi bacterium]|nr:hypothetical protein [Chloroflexota bacterium]